MFSGQREAGVTVPQFVEFGGFAFTARAARAAVSEAGQRGAHFHALHRHGALDGFTQLRHKRELVNKCSEVSHIYSAVLFYYYLYTCGALRMTHGQKKNLYCGHK